MPQKTIIYSATTNAGNFGKLADGATAGSAALALPSGRCMMLLNNPTGAAVNLVCGATTAAEAATAFSAGAYWVFSAATSIGPIELDPATTWVRSSDTTSRSLNIIASW
jgi:hypothetical protein